MTCPGTCPLRKELVVAELDLDHFEQLNCTWFASMQLTMRLSGRHGTPLKASPHRFGHMNVARAYGLSIDHSHVRMSISSVVRLWQCSIGLIGHRSVNEVP